MTFVGDRGLCVSHARDLGPQFVANPHRMIGQDGAYSIPLGEESLWYFGDTLVGARVPHESLWYPGGRQLGPGDMSGQGTIEQMLTNTGLVLRNRTGRDGLTEFSYICDACGRIRQLVPHLDSEDTNEIRVWCLHGLAVDSRVYLYYIVVRMLAGGPMPVNFELVGSGLAVGTRGEWQFARLTHKGSALWWKDGQPLFASAVCIPAEADFVHLYGVRKDGDGVQYCSVARVRTAELDDLEAYQYLSSMAPRWSRRIEDAIPVMSGMPNEMSVSWNNHLGCYLAVHSLDLTGRIVGRTARTPWGPWSEPGQLWQVTPPQRDCPVPYPPLIYAGKEHPELADDGGRVLYLTYVEFEEYYPHLVEIALC